MLLLTEPLELLLIFFGLLPVDRVPSFLTAFALCGPRQVPDRLDEEDVWEVRFRSPVQVKVVPLLKEGVFVMSGTDFRAYARAPFARQVPHTSEADKAVKDASVMLPFFARHVFEGRERPSAKDLRRPAPPKVGAPIVLAVSRDGQRAQMDHVVAMVAEQDYSWDYDEGVAEAGAGRREVGSRMAPWCLGQGEAR